MQKLLLLIIILLSFLTSCSSKKKGLPLLLLGAAAAGSSASPPTTDSSLATDSNTSSANSTNSYEAAGVLDDTFDSDGISTKTDVNQDYIINGLAIQNDGKIILAGRTQGTLQDFVVLRYNTNGSLDTTFGTSGEVLTNIVANDEANAVAIQTDGKIVVVGTANNGNLIAIVRYNANGSLDTSFGTSGIVQISGNWPSAKSVQIQSDGKIVVSGYENISSINQFITYRLNSDGTLDNSFGTSGKVATPFGSNFAEGYSNVLQSDGKIIVVGQVQKSTESDFAVVRYNSNGTLDTSFNSTGMVDNTSMSDSERGHAVRIQSDGKILVAGYSNVSGNQFALIRYNSNGSLDTAFGSSGKVSTSVPSSTAASAYSMTVQSNGRILVGGEAILSGYSYFAIARYNTNGSIDTSFGQSGFVVEKIFTDPNTTSYGIKAMALQSDGKLVVAGSVYDGNYYRPVVARFK